MNDFSKINILGSDIYCKDIYARSVPYCDAAKEFSIDLTGNTFCTEALQNAVDSAASVIILRPGRYSIDASINIPSDKTIIGYGATVITSANNAFINKSSGTSGGYLANSNITIKGIHFMPSDSVVNCTLVAFGHSQNCEINECVFSDLKGWHMVEINSCNNIRITDCTFKNYTGSGTSEMLQFDIASDASVFPWFGPFDNTPCTDIRVENCEFYNDDTITPANSAWYPAGIGNHNFAADISGIVISNCNFRNLNSAFNFYDLNNSIITDCAITNCEQGLHGVWRFTENIIANCKFSGNRKTEDTYNTNTFYKRGLYIENKQYGIVNHNTITNCNFKNFASHGVCPEGEENVVANCNISDCGLHGIYVGYASEKNTVKNCVIKNNALLSDLPSKFYDIFLNVITTDFYKAHDSHVIANNVAGTVYTSLGSSGKSYLYDNVVDSVTRNSGGTLIEYNNTEYNGSPSAIYNIEGAISDINAPAKTWTTLRTIAINNPGIYSVSGMVAVNSTDANADVTIDIYNGTGYLARTTGKVSSVLSTTSFNTCNNSYISAGTTITLRVYSSVDISSFNYAALKATLITAAKPL